VGSPELILWDFIFPPLDSPCAVLAGLTTYNRRRRRPVRDGG
jgi:hypothetical protein